MQLPQSQDGNPDLDDRNAIGVVGGMGPMAGIDLVRAIFEETDAQSDQEHLPVTLISYPGRIPDRSTWLANPNAPSPLPGILDVLYRLEIAGCSVAGIPCNTAHAPRLYARLQKHLRDENRSIRLIHIVDAIVEHLAETAPEARRVGILATRASLESHLHQKGLARRGLETLCPADPDQAEVQEAIFNSEWGLKATSQPSAQAREILLKTIENLSKQGAGCIILGCTELPLAIPEPNYAGLPLISSTKALARALIRAIFPDKLRSLPTNEPHTASGTLSLR